MSTLEQIKNLREKTGAGIVEVKKALEESQGDENKAIEILRQRGMDKAEKKSEREAKEGLIATYVHSNGKVGVMIKLLCETDFVAKNEEFKELAKDIAMHIAAMNPKFTKPEEAENEEEALLSQKFVKNPEITVSQLIAEKIGKIGENIQVGEFFRMEL